MALTRAATAAELRIRGENRYVYHPQGQRKCTRCETVFDTAAGNFMVHHTNANGVICYEGPCKQCSSLIRGDRTDRIKTNIATYSKRLLPSIRHRASSESIPFELSVTDLVVQWNMQEGMCYYTGQPMDLTAKKQNRRSPHGNFPSLDKKVRRFGYVSSNVVWSLWDVNKMKSDVPHDQFISFCKLVGSRF